MGTPRYQFSIRALLIVTLLSAIGLLVWLNRPTGAMNDHVDIPPDFEGKVSELFSDPDSQQEVLALIEHLHGPKVSLNVGPSQLCRAILVLSDGELSEFKRLAAIPADPRDIIIRGERKLGDPRDWFATPFDGAIAGTSPSKVELAKDDFSESGYEFEDYGRVVHYWRTETGHLFSAWVGGDFKRTGEAFIWSLYHHDSDVRVRLRQNNVLGDWIKMHPAKGETERRVLKVSLAEGRVGIQFQVDDQVFDEVFITIRNSSGA